MALQQASSNERGYRLTSIDMLRGLAIVIMAIDHVRDQCFAGASQDPLANPNVGPAMFITRWITHFCAPVFTALAGVSAGLMIGRKSPRELSRFLITRGLWLVLVEVTLISTAISFRPQGIPEMGGHTVLILQTLFAIGTSMMVLGLLQRLGRRTCLGLGIAIVVAHNALDPTWPAPHMGAAPLWVGLHAQMSIDAGPFFILWAYPLLPWIGVMLLGFGASAVFELAPESRDRLLRRIGIAMTTAFLAVRALDLYGDPNPWQAHAGDPAATVMDFLNTTKYPPSLMFVLMTLGPAAIVCSYADRIARGPLARVTQTLAMFGRVPFAFYVAHFYLIHTISVVIGVIQGHSVAQMCTLFMFYPKGTGVTLWGVYLIWALVIAILYPFCRWVAAVKARRRDWWLSYL